MKLPKNFPKFQTAAWWIEQLKECNPKAVIMIAAGPGPALGAMLSLYPDEDHLSENDLLKSKKIWIDVGLE